MHWQEAIQKSTKGTAFRRTEDTKYRHTFVRYDDGSCYRLTAFKDSGKVDYDKSRDAQLHEIEGYNDWQPSI